MFFKIILLISITILLLIPKPSKCTDSSSIRIITDVENVILQINNDTINVDSFNNKLMANKWFILNLPSGTYNLNLKPSDHSSWDTTFVLAEDSILTIKKYFIPSQQLSHDSIIIPDSLIQINIRSIPTNANILIDGEQLDNTTPFKLKLNNGFHEVLVVSDGWEPLIHAFNSDNLHDFDLNFLLRPLPPPKVEPESLGMELLKEYPLIDIKKAEYIENKYNSFAETFLVIPLTQGVIMRAIVDEDDKRSADILISSGIILTGGSYLFGKIFSSRKRSEIIKKNEIIVVDNILIKIHNNELIKEIRRIDSEAYKKWLKENSDKGRVEVIAK